MIRTATVRGPAWRSSARYVSVRAAAVAAPLAVTLTLGAALSSIEPLIWFTTTPVPLTWLASARVEPSLIRIRSGRAIVLPPGRSAATSTQYGGAGSERRVPSASDEPVSTEASIQKPALSRPQPR